MEVYCIMFMILIFVVVVIIIIIIAINKRDVEYELITKLNAKRIFKTHFFIFPYCVSYLGNYTHRTHKYLCIVSHFIFSYYALIYFFTF